MPQALEVFSLAELGYGADLDEAFEQYATAGLVPGRVAVQHRGAYDVYTERGEVRASVPGRLFYESESALDLPAVGDWVALEVAGDGTAIAHAVLPRRTAFVRIAASAQHRASEEQVVAANVDVVFLVSGLVDDLNLRRLERYLVLAWESGAQPVVVLTKSDLCADVDATVGGGRIGRGRRPRPRRLERDRRGCRRGAPYFAGHRTVAALGSSGVGKSSLINRLAGRSSRRPATSGPTAAAATRRPVGS